MKKRAPSAPSPHDMCTFPLYSLFFCCVTAYIAVPGRSAQAQRAATTWAVSVLDDSRCAQEAGFRERLVGQIPRGQQASAAEAELVAELRVVRKRDGLTATVTVRDRLLDAPAGERVIDLPFSNCDETADALSLVIGVLVEAGRGAPVTDRMDVPPPARASPPPAPTQSARPGPRPAARYSWLGPRPGHDLSVGAGASFGLLPGLALGATLQWVLRMPELWPIVLGASTYLPAETSNGRARFRADYGSVAACPIHRAWTRLRGRVCPAFSAGLEKAEGLGFPETRKVTQPVVLLGVELGADVRLGGPLTVGFLARLDVPLLRQRFSYYDRDGSTPALHQAKVVMTSSFLTVGLRFR